MIPVRAIILITVTASLLGLVNIGSSTAFNALTSLALIGHYTSYLLPITLLVFRRFGKKEIPWGPWTLGRWGLPINLISMAYSIVLIVFMVFPPYQPVRAENMSYASVIFGAAILVSTVLWFVYGRKTYWGPVREVLEELHIKE
jgi:choline transport protein